MFPIYDQNRPVTKPFMNYILIASNVVLFFHFYLQGPRAFEEAILRYGMIPAYILKGARLHTVLTSMFMHGDPMHLFGNMLFLYIFGDNVEDAFGHLRYVLFYLLGGIGATLIHILSMFMMPETVMLYSLRIPAIGASGAISAVLGAYMILYPRARIKTLVMYFYIMVVSIPAFYYIGFWFFYQLIYGIMALRIPLGVAFWAHIGGFVTGVFIVKAFGVRPRPRRRRVIPYRIPED